MSRCPRFNDLMSSRTKVTTLLCWPHSIPRFEKKQKKSNERGEASECFVRNYSTVMSSEISYFFVLPLVSLRLPDIITLKSSEKRKRLESKWSGQWMRVVSAGNGHKVPPEHLVWSRGWLSSRFERSKKHST